MISCLNHNHLPIKLLNPILTNLYDVLYWKNLDSLMSQHLKFLYLKPQNYLTILNLFLPQYRL
nr:MAG TPA: hypothetical protein [Caudoviricetes sp.]